MTCKSLFFLIIMLVSQASIAQFGYSSEEIAVLQKIEARDWAYLRAYLKEEDAADGTIPGHGFVLRSLIFDGHDDFARELIEDRDTMAKFSEEEYIDLIQIAMYANNLGMGRLLLERYTLLPFSAPTNSMGPLFAMAIGESREFVPLFLAAGVDPNAPVYDSFPLTLALSYTHPRRRWDQTPEEYAEDLNIYGGPKEHAEMFWKLVESGADVELAINQNDGIVAAAGILGDQDIFNYLLDHGGDINEISSGSTALTTAALQGHDFMETIPFLLNLRADTCLEAKAGGTAYDFLLMAREVDAAKVLPELLCPEKIHFAFTAFAGDLELMDFLLDKGAGVNDPGVDVTGTALIYASTYGSNTSQSIPYLLEHGADVCATDSEGLTAYDGALTSLERLDVIRNFPQLLCPKDIKFHLAGIFGDADIMEFLLEQGADINSADRFGRTALINAVNSPSPLLAVPFLLERGADVCREDRDGNTAYEEAVRLAGTWQTGDVFYSHDPAVLLELVKEEPQLFCPGKVGLSGAIKTGDAELVEFQLAQGAMVNEADSSGGFSPLMWAVNQRRNHLTIIPLLLVHGADVCYRASFGSTAYEMAVQSFRSAEELALLPELLCQER